MKLIIVLGSIALALALDDGQQQDPYAAALQAKSDQFTANMFTEVVKSHPNENVVLSAFSVMPPLAQLALASVGDSHDELLRAIGLPNDNVTKAVFSGVSARLTSVKGVTLNMANRIYLAKDAELNPSFAAVSRDIFNSEFKNIDFAEKVKSAMEINHWVEQQTNERIKDLVDPDSLSLDTRAVLVNAIYFKGSWQFPFKTYATSEKDFHVTKDLTVKVPTMFNSADFRYGESAELDAKLLEMPYEGDESSFLIVLPNKIDGLAELQQKLREPKVFEAAKKNMASTLVNVYLPKFKIETTTDLKDVLQKLYITKLFTPNARLDNLLKKESNLYISNAVQKAFIEVNEEGAEAGAANAFGVSYLSAFVPTPENFVADHPFVFYLKEDENILFSGLFLSPPVSIENNAQSTEPNVELQFGIGRGYDRLSTVVV